MITAARALRSRAATSLLIFVIATIAVAGGAGGPTYYRAGQISVLRDTVAAQEVAGRGYEVTESGPVTMSFGPTDSEVSADLGSAASLFSIPVQARYAHALYAAAQENLLLASSSGLCAHLHIQGVCPQQAGQIIVSRRLADLNGWRPKQTVNLAPWGPLTITGTYRPPGTGDGYWFDQLGTYFPVEYGPGPSGHSLLYDAVFAASSTVLKAAPTMQGTVVVNATVTVDRLRRADEAILSSRLSTLLQDSSLQARQAVVTTSIPTTMGQVRAGWTTLAVPVVVVTLELLALASLLLWILVSDATAARGPEIALAKLRGYGRARLTAFALAELGILILGAIPVGVLVGWAAATGISSGLLRPGTPIGLPVLGWAAGAAAALGGVVAAVVGARPTVRRPVLEQWRHSSQRPSRPGWAFDAIMVTGAAAGVAEVAVSGAVSSTHHHPLALLVPGLVGLGAAVIAARLLPEACAAAAARLRRGGPAIFLALRQLSRRPGAMRTTTVLAAAFALASFALSAWSVARNNFATVASAQVGAPTVLDVTTSDGSDLSSLARDADPSGRNATAVEEYFNNNITTVAVNPTQWARIALRGATGPTSSELKRLAPAEAPPLTLNGSALRLDLRTEAVSPPGTSLIVNVLSPNSTAPTPVQFPALPATGPTQLTASLPPCPCLVEDVVAEPPPAAYERSNLRGSVTITGIDVNRNGGWTPLPGAALAAGRWRPAGSTDQVSAAPGGFSWAFQATAGSASLDYRDRPFPLPAIAAQAVTSQTGPFDATGLDGTSLAVDVIGTVPTTPGAPGTGIIVDLDFAQLAAEGNLALAQQQIWLSGHEATIEARLRRAGVTIDQVSTSAHTAAVLARSGPGLADTLFLAEAATAAALAAGTAMAALYLLARRRRYELAALQTVGVDRKGLITSVLIEQALLVAYGAGVGVAAGLASAAVLLRDLPEFATPPTGVPLATFPAAVPLVPVLVGALMVVLVAAAAASIRLVAGTQVTGLREPPA